MEKKIIKQTSEKKTTDGKKAKEKTTPDKKETLVEESEAKAKAKAKDEKVEKKDPASVEIVNTEEIDQFYDFVDFSLEGTSYKTTVNKKYIGRKKYELPNPKLVRAFIPGTIQKLFVSDGSRVKMHEKLLVLEAMKMKNVLVAPMAGKIKKVYVKQGALVSKNEVLVEME